MPETEKPAAAAGEEAEAVEKVKCNLHFIENSHIKYILCFITFFLSAPLFLPLTLSTCVCLVHLFYIKTTIYTVINNVGIFVVVIIASVIVIVIVSDAAHYLCTLFSSPTSSETQKKKK